MTCLFLGRSKCWFSWNGSITGNGRLDAFDSDNGFAGLFDANRCMAVDRGALDGV